MSDKSANSIIHREFELERMILFSDAVFAIAITLLIIEIKFPELPENYKEEGIHLFQMFKPTLKEFVGFFVSFFFIGVSWARHLKLFRYLRAYDNKVIIFNLLSLLFIVSFPFSASGIVHIRPTFMFPMVIYLGNIMLVGISNLLLSHYIFKHKPSLSIPGHDEEKRYIYKQSIMFSVSLTASFVIVLSTAIISGYDNMAMTVSFYSLPFIFLGMKRWLKKYKPKKVKEFL